MKLVLVAFTCCLAIQQASTQIFGLNNCPAVKAGPPNAPVAGKYYQVLRFKLNNLAEVPKCRNFKLITNADKSLTFNQSVVGPFEVVLNQTFVAKANATNGYWEVLENAKSSSSIFLDVSSSKSIIVTTCKQEAIMPLVQGVYSLTKTLPADELQRVTDVLKKNNITQVETVNHASCKN